MDLQARLDELLRVAEEMGLTIQRVPLGGDVFTLLCSAK